MSRQRLQTLLMLVIVFAVMSWPAYFWMVTTGLRPTRRSYYTVRTATPRDVAAMRNLAIVFTAGSGVLVWLTRKRPPVP